MYRKFRPQLAFTVLTILAVFLTACSSATTLAPTTAPTSPPAATNTTAPTTAPATENSPASSATGPEIIVTKNATLGDILTDSNGNTLYMFENDSPGTSTCTGACAQLWPPLTVPSGETASAGSGVNATLGTITRPDGTIQVTIDNYPVYYYAQDTKAGDTNGEGIKNIWFVMGPSGNAVMGASTEATSTPQASMTGTIALLLPETKTARYETADRPDFEAKFKELCPDCKIIYSNANQDANAQLSQAQAALTNGAQVLVLDPVDSNAAGAIADLAKQQNVPVIAYDRLINNSDGVNYYISFDNQKVGELQAQSLVDRLNALGIQDPQIVMINGSPTDNNASQFKAGAHSVFDPLVAEGKLTIAKEYDTPDWSPDQAQNEMQQALTALNNKVDGVYAANDGTAGGAIAAMKAAGLNPLPPVTGQDAELAAIQRILVGEQYMTVYKAIKPEADTAAEIAYDLMTNTPVPESMTGGATINNNKIDVPYVKLNPVAVTKDNIKDTVVADGFWTVSQICTADYATACADAGLK